MDAVIVTIGIVYEVVMGKLKTKMKRNNSGRQIIEKVVKNVDRRINIFKR